MKQRHQLLPLTAMLSMGVALTNSCDETISENETSTQFKKEKFAQDLKEVCRSPFSVNKVLPFQQQQDIHNLIRLQKDLYRNPSLAENIRSTPSILHTEYALNPKKFSISSQEIKTLLLLADDNAISILKDHNFVGFCDYARSCGINLSEHDSWGIASLGANLKPGTDPNIFAAVALGIVIYVAAATIAAVEVAVTVHFALSVSIRGAQSLEQHKNNVIEESIKSLIQQEVIDSSTVDELKIFLNQLPNNQ